MACSSTRQTCLESLCIQGARLHSGAEPKVHNFFIDLSALELSLVLTQPSGIRQQLREKRVRSLQTHAISSVHP